MQKKETGIDGLFVLEAKMFGDERGYFFESFNSRVWSELGLETVFCQQNVSVSCKGVLRGLHFQAFPFSQLKVVRCLEGEVYDVAVDCRSDSETFGKWYGVQLSAHLNNALYIPGQFAHGFLVLSEFARVQYLTDNFYNKGAEGGLKYNDAALGIEWPGEITEVNDRDRGWVDFDRQDFPEYFNIK